MNLGGTQACKTTIQDFVAAKNLRRLKEMLPVIFDVHGIYARDTQLSVLRECNLVPVVERLPWPQVTFALD